MTCPQCSRRAAERPRTAPRWPPRASCPSWLLVALPLAAPCVLLLGGRRTDRWGHWLARRACRGPRSSSGAAAVPRRCSVAAPRSARSDLHLFSWVPAGSFQVDAGLRLDPLSLTFVLLVTFVGSLIHVYSVAYMEHDPDRRRFFAYLNLFVAAMLLLVLADSYLLLYVGWEGVGLASYLLIGFWNHQPDVRRRGQEGVRASTGSATSACRSAIMVDVRDVRRGRLRRRCFAAAPEASEGWLTASA